MAATLAAYDQRAIRTTKRVFLKSTELPLAQSLDAAGEAMLLMREIDKCSPSAFVPSKAIPFSCVFFSL